jgi:endonuclease/exonuclease/phosphatase family metal-dependent hydrolase
MNYKLTTAVSRSLLILGCLTSTTFARPLELISWNIESGGADPAIIASQLAKLPKVDAYLLQEVNPRDLGRLAAAVRKAHGDDYKYYMGSLGGSDRLAMIIDASRLTIRSFTELMSYQEHRLNDWRHRPPLVAQLELKDAQQEFLLVTVHLARRNAQLRQEQAVGLREWAKAQSLPVLLAGDCNFDFEFGTNQGNQAHRLFFADGVWRETEPEKRIDTNWSDRNQDGRDDYPDSSLDFAASCTHGLVLQTACRVIVREGDFPDTDATSDHRPVWMSIELR